MIIHRTVLLNSLYNILPDQAKILNDIALDDPGSLDHRCVIANEVLNAIQGALEREEEIIIDGGCDD